MKLAFILGNFSVGNRPLFFENVWTNSRALTGTDLGILMVAKEMAFLGHDVSLFTIFNDNAITWKGVKLFQLSSLTQMAKENNYDAFLSWNEPDVLRAVPEASLRIVAQQLNDFRYCSPDHDDFVDIWLSPCDFHMNHMKTLNKSPEKWQVLPNGCESSWYKSNPVPGRVVWTSSADRGLHILLQEWMNIKKAVPEAHLKIFYNFGFSHVEQIDPNDTTNPVMTEMGNRIRYIKAMISKLKNHGVECVGSISRHQMEKELNEAMVLAYPCSTLNMTEGFSISILEACAAGVVPVITDRDALGSIYGKHAAVVESPVEKNLAKFNEYVIKGLTDDEFRNKIISQCKALAENYKWSDISLKLEKIIKESPKFNENKDH